MKSGDLLSLGMMQNCEEGGRGKGVSHHPHHPPHPHTFFPWYSTFRISPHGKEILGESWSSCSYMLSPKASTPNHNCVSLRFCGSRVHSSKFKVQAKRSIQIVVKNGYKYLYLKVVDAIHFQVLCHSQVLQFCLFPAGRVWRGVCEGVRVWLLAGQGVECWRTVAFPCAVRTSW